MHDAGEAEVFGEGQRMLDGDELLTLVRGLTLDELTFRKRRRIITAG